ncbi:MAG: YhbY family RNA-binding protein [Opitutales bacterium]|nr:YhbY family RNA-binding protein [Opitutales bacterium]
MKLSGKERGTLKSIFKIRPIDLKRGRKGITANFIKEAKQIVSKDKMIKIALGKDKQERRLEAEELEQLLKVELISCVGKTASFYSREDN